MIFGRMVPQYRITCASGYTHHPSFRTHSKQDSEEKPTTPKPHLFRKKPADRLADALKFSSGIRNKQERSPFQRQRSPFPRTSKENMRPTRYSANRGSDKSSDGTCQIKANLNSRNSPNRGQSRNLVNLDYYNTKALPAKKKKQAVCNQKTPRSSDRRTKMSDFCQRPQRRHQLITLSGFEKSRGSLSEKWRRPISQSGYQKNPFLQRRTTKARYSQKQQPIGSTNNPLFGAICNYLDHHRDRGLLSRSKLKAQRKTHSSGATLQSQSPTAPPQRNNTADSAYRAEPKQLQLLAESYMVELSPQASAIFILDGVPDSSTSLSQELNRMNQHTARQEAYLSDYLQCRQQLIELEFQDKLRNSHHRQSA